MPISGFIGAGAQEALDDVLARRLQEQTRRAIETQRQQELQLRREQMAMEQQQQQALQDERSADRTYRQGQVERGDAALLAQDLMPGEISSQQAGMLRKHPGLAPRVTERKVIDARPIAGTTPLDQSGPQQFNVLEPTRAQAEQQLKTVNLRRIGEQLAGATDEQQRRSIGARAMAEGLDVPANLLGQTGTEKTAQELADERRANAEWERRNAITNTQANARQAASDRLMRERAVEGRDTKPPTAAQTTLASYAARLEQAEPTLAGLEATITQMNPMVFQAQAWADHPSLQSAEMQQYMQASRNLINAVLRRESGAVISPSEFAEARKQYLPVPGDTKETLTLKRQNRALNAATFKRGAGRAYQSVEDALAGETPDDTTIQTVAKDPTTGKWVVQRGG